MSSAKAASSLAEREVCSCGCSCGGGGWWGITPTTSIVSSSFGEGGSEILWMVSREAVKEGERVEAELEGKRFCKLSGSFRFFCRKENPRGRLFPTEGEAGGEEGNFSPSPPSLSFSPSAFSPSSWANIDTNSATDDLSFWSLNLTEALLEKALSLFPSPSFPPIIFSRASTSTLSPPLDFIRSERCLCRPKVPNLLFLPSFIPLPPPTPSSFPSSSSGRVVFLPMVALTFFRLLYLFFWSLSPVE